MDKLLREKQAGTFWGPWSQDLERNSFSVLEKAACASTCFLRQPARWVWASCWGSSSPRTARLLGECPQCAGHGGEAVVITAEATKRWRRGTQQNLSERLKNWAKDGPKCAVVFKHTDMQMDISWGFTNINRNSMELQKYQSDYPNIWMLLERWSLGPVWWEIRYAGLVTTESLWMQLSRRIPKLCSGLLVFC